jgi:glucosamine 6-phosphate synthetase-like amidotransferase/phosphosugar isomerase protein
MINFFSPIKKKMENKVDVCILEELDLAIGCSEPCIFKYQDRIVEALIIAYEQGKVKRKECDDILKALKYYTDDMSEIMYDKDEQAQFARNLKERNSESEN